MSSIEERILSKSDEEKTLDIIRHKLGYGLTGELVKVSNARWRFKVKTRKGHQLGLTEPVIYNYNISELIKLISENIKEKECFDGIEIEDNIHLNFYTTDNFTLDSFKLAGLKGLNVHHLNHDRITLDLRGVVDDELRSLMIKKWCLGFNVLSPKDDYKNAVILTLASRSNLPQGEYIDPELNECFAPYIYLLTHCDLSSMPYSVCSKEIFRIADKAKALFKDHVEHLHSMYAPVGIPEELLDRKIADMIDLTPWNDDFVEFVIELSQLMCTSGIYDEWKKKMIELDQHDRGYKYVKWYTIVPILAMEFGIINKDNYEEYPFMKDFMYGMKVLFAYLAGMDRGIKFVDNSSYYMKDYNEMCLFFENV